MPHHGGGTRNLHAVRNGCFKALGFVDSIRLDQPDQFHIRLAEFHTDAIFIHMPDSRRDGQIFRSIGSLEQ